MFNSLLPNKSLSPFHNVKVCYVLVSYSVSTITDTFRPFYYTKTDLLQTTSQYLQSYSFNPFKEVMKTKSGHLISSHLGFVHPLQDVALHQCLPSSSVCCLPNPGGSLLLCYVILPSSAWSSSQPLPSPWLPLCASPCPPIVL